LDLVGLDVNLAVTAAIHAATGAERLRPSALQTNLVRAGHLGRKTGRGFHGHDGTAPTPTRTPTDLDADADAARPPAGPPLDAGAIVERIELALANEAFHALAEGVASAEDIDRALELGANHPHGP